MRKKTTRALKIIRKLLEDTGIKQKAIAETAGISESYLSDILNSERKLTPELEVLITNAINKRRGVK